MIENHSLSIYLSLSTYLSMSIYPSSILLSISDIFQTSFISQSPSSSRSSSFCLPVSKIPPPAPPYLKTPFSLVSPLPLCSCLMSAVYSCSDWTSGFTQRKNKCKVCRWLIMPRRRLLQSCTRVLSFTLYTINVLLHLNLVIHNNK